MVTRNIRCGACGFEGKIEAHDTVNVVPESEILKNLGKDSSTDYLHSRCPVCGAVLDLDPVKMLVPGQWTGRTAGSRSQRYVPIISGLIYSTAAFLLFVVGSWWAFLVGGILAMFGWVSLKTGFSASSKEIDELTGRRPVSEETERKFIERL